MSFDRAVKHVLAFEKGYVYHPIDRGGPTNYGITMQTLAAWRAPKPVTIDDVASLTIAEAKLIYRARYWNALELDLIASPRVAFLLFDRCVNSGQKNAVTLAQKALNATGLSLTVDGVMGDETREALAHVNADAFSKAFLRESQIFYARICQVSPSQLTFLVGWLTRTHDAEDIALSL